VICSDRARCPAQTMSIGRPSLGVTKQQLADHLGTRRWIESQQPLGLPHLPTGGMNRYRISELLCDDVKARRLGIADELRAVPSPSSARSRRSPALSEQGNEICMIVHILSKVYELG
jgi:hypothetical protein